MTFATVGQYEVDGKTYLTDRDRPRGNSEAISDGYFTTLGLKILEGRDFTIEDTDCEAAGGDRECKLRAQVLGQPEARRTSGSAASIPRKTSNGARSSASCRTR